VIAVQLDAVPGDGLAGLGDRFDDALRPPVFDADHDHRRDVRIRPRANQRTEMELEIRAELQPAVRMRDRQRALHVVRDRFCRGVRQIIDGKNDHMVADTDAPVLAPVALKSRLHGGASE